LFRHGGDVRDDLRFVIIDRRRTQCGAWLSAGKQSGEAKDEYNYTNDRPIHNGLLMFDVEVKISRGFTLMNADRRLSASICG